MMGKVPERLPLPARRRCAPHRRRTAVLVFALAVGVSVAMGPGTAPAQVPTGVLPGVVPYQFEAPLVPRPRRRIGIIIPEDLKCPDPGAVGARRFTLSALIVGGVTLYDEDDLARLWQGRLGRSVDVCEVHAIARMIGARYRKDGHPEPRVVLPAQEIVGGVVRIRVIEKSSARE